ncbi:FAD:protein FMN transferase [Devosia sp. SD17-2]|uniref:FAD:protein FMN transferase n=1 Tax=Devosia sp. SD17-2 TaxID=2976459 RepID=UPI0023D8665D|nr:FAD:protein FMN transferase [Devosia sp. SD17-2]WEJ35049.1 FAD:protein FMN transferase [Devosia sp. SD17-2]
MNLHRPNRRLILAAGLAAIAAPALARSPAATTVLDGSAFGTGWSVTLPERANAGHLRPALEAVLVRIDRLMSPWRADSAVTHFNHTQMRDPVRVDTELHAVTAAALALRSDSAGSYDPAVGPLVHRWGFGPISGAFAAERPGFELTDDALRKWHPGLTLDLCGTAKGYALDQLARTLQLHGAEDFIVDLGGEIAARGHHPSGRNWHVAVEDPRPGTTGAVEVVDLHGRAIATSGNKVNGFTLGARRYSHIIDPGTAEPVVGSAASVSVIADAAMTADGWATALMAAGTAGPVLAQQHGIDALFLFDESTGLRRVAVNRFAEHLL